MYIYNVEKQSDFLCYLSLFRAVKSLLHFFLVALFFVTVIYIGQSEAVEAGGASNEKKEKQERVYIEPECNEAFSEFMSFRAENKKKLARGAVDHFRDAARQCLEYHKELNEYFDKNALEKVVDKYQEQVGRYGFLLHLCCAREQEVKKYVISVIDDELQRLELLESCKRLKDLHLEDSDEGRLSGEPLADGRQGGEGKLKSAQVLRDFIGDINFEEERKAYIDFKKMMEKSKGETETEDGSEYQAQNFNKRKYLSVIKTIITSNAEVDTEKDSEERMNEDPDENTEGQGSGKEGEKKRNIACVKLSEKLKVYIERAICNLGAALDGSAAQRLSDIFNERPSLAEKTYMELLSAAYNRNDDFYFFPCLLVMVGSMSHMIVTIISMITISDNYKENIIGFLNATILEGDRGPDCMEAFSNEWSIANGGTSREDSTVIYTGHIEDIKYNGSFHEEHMFILANSLGLSMIQPFFIYSADRINSKLFKREQERIYKKRKDKWKESGSSEFMHSIARQLSDGNKNTCDLGLYEEAAVCELVEFIALTHMTSSIGRSLMSNLKALDEQRVPDAKYYIDMERKYAGSIFEALQLLVKDLYYLTRYRDHKGIAFRVNMHVSSLFFVAVITLMPQYVIPMVMQQELLHTNGFIYSDQVEINRLCNQWVAENFNDTDGANTTILHIFHDIYGNPNSEQRHIYLHTNHAVEGPLAVKENLKTTHSDILIYLITAWSDSMYMGIQFALNKSVGLVKVIGNKCWGKLPYLPCIERLRRRNPSVERNGENVP